MFIALSTALPAAQAGKLKVLAVVARRSAIAPEIPTITEQGFPSGHRPIYQDRYAGDGGGVGR